MSVLLTADDGGVRVLTMNRPEARNALSTQLFEALHTALLAADADESVRAVVLTGTDPAFCAGVDLKEAQALGREYFRRFATHDCMAALKQMYTHGSATVTGPALVAEREISAANPADTADLAARRRDVAARNKNQIKPAKP